MPKTCLNLFKFPKPLLLKVRPFLTSKIVTQSKTLPPGPPALESEAILE